MAKPSDPLSERVVASNRKALHEYEIFDKYEAGLVLLGTEVKALRDGKCNLAGAFARLDGGELWLHGIEISEYSHGNRQNHTPKRVRKLLLHRAELRKIDAKVRERGFTLVALRLYFKGGIAKVEIGVARGLKVHDQREAKAKREAKRDIARALGRKDR